jgi:signal transduction histidine kinase
LTSTAGSVVGSLVIGTFAPKKSSVSSSKPPPDCVPLGAVFEDRVGGIRTITEEAIGARLDGHATFVEEYERELERRNDALNDIVSVLSHDLQSPLNVVSGRAELALKTGNLDHVESIVEATERMEHLVEDLLTLARKGRTVGETEPTTLSTVVEGAWSEVRAPDTDLIVETDATVSLGTPMYTRGSRRRSPSAVTWS